MLETQKYDPLRLLPVYNEKINRSVNPAIDNLYRFADSENPLN
jgi:hypothetical protein